MCGLSTCAKVTVQVDQTEVVMDGESAELAMDQQSFDNNVLVLSHAGAQTVLTQLDELITSARDV